MSAIPDAALGSPHSKLAAHPTPWSWLVREIETTARMMGHNATINLLPEFWFALAAMAVTGVSGARAVSLCGALFLLNFFYGYTFDASNQSSRAAEDELNKPWRPVPAGLVSAQGLRRRYWVATPVYTLLGWYFGVVEWVLLWQITVFLMNLVLPQRHYRWFKTPCMISGNFAFLAIGWQVVAPLDSLALTWILIGGMPHVAALIYEDVRDVVGDDKIGRVTWVTVFGDRNIRIWAAGWMVAIPFLHHFLLYLPVHPSLPRLLLCDAWAFSSCWYSAYRMLYKRRINQDRVTYQIYIVSYLLCLLSFPVLYL